MKIGNGVTDEVKRTSCTERKRYSFRQACTYMYSI